MASFSHDNPQLAQAYERLSDMQFEGGKRLVERIGLKAGERVLDVGCGTGRLARWMAEIVGPRGVVGIDPLPDRISVARRLAPGLSFEVGNAEDLGAFGDETFDAVCMSAVFHWVREKRKALAESRRVLRRGGRLGMTTTPSELRLSSTIAGVCAAVLTGPPYVGRINTAEVAGTWLGSTVTELIAALTEARLALIELHVVRRSQRHASGEAVVDFLEASSFGNFLHIVPDDLRAAFRADVAAGLDARKDAGGILLQDHGLVVVAEPS